MRDFESRQRLEFATAPGWQDKKEMLCDIPS